MEPTIIELSDDVKSHLADDLLALADSKHVLGNWCARVVFNGRSVADFATLMALCGSSYGHTRTLYQYLVNFGLPYAWLEQTRPRDEYRAMNLLDEPPSSWADFIATLYLGESVMWAFASRFVATPLRPLSGLVQKMGHESNFHLKYAMGWMKAFDEDEKEVLRLAIGKRQDSALDWLSPWEPSDPLFDAKLATARLSDSRKLFHAAVAEARHIAGTPAEREPSRARPREWRMNARRTGSIPPGLFEIMRFKDPLVHGAS